MQLKQILRNRLSNSGSVVYPISLQSDIIGEFGTFRSYQIPFLNYERYALNISPVGSGKSIMMLAIAAKRYLKHKSTVIIVPKHGIAGTIKKYTKGTAFNFVHQDERYYLANGSLVTPHNSSELTDWLENDYVAAVCCYKTFLNAYRTLSDEAKSNLLVTIDEAHHSSTHNTELGALTKQLFEDDVACGLWTATAFRADGSELIDSTIASDFKITKRTLMEHFKDGECPDFNIHFKLYEHIGNQDAEKYKITGSTIKIGSIDALLDSYIEQYLKDPSKQTLMVIPSSILSGGRKYSAALACHSLESKLTQAWRKKFKRKPLNIVQLGSSDGKTLITNNRSNQFLYDKLNSTEHVDVTIAINSMDEGVDWPDCCQTFIPRVPTSMVRTMQLAIGRALRRPKSKNHKHKKWNGKCWGAADVWFFEIGIDLSHQDVIAPAIRDLAARIKCLCFGVEFRHPIELFKVKRDIRRRIDKEKQQMINLGPVKLMGLDKQLNKMVCSGLTIDDLIEKITKWAKDRNITISKQATIEYLAEISILDAKEIRKRFSSERAKKFLITHKDDHSEEFFDLIKNSLTLNGLADVINILTDQKFTLQEIQRGLLYHYPTIEEAMIAVRKLQIRDAKEYKTKRHADPRLPANPDRRYHNWQNWYHYTGRSTPKPYESLLDAQKAVQKLGIKTVAEYSKRYSEDDQLPSAPNEYYASEWQNWPHYFTGDTKVKYATISKAKKAVKRLGIVSLNEYRQRYKEDSKLPSAPNQFYKDQWLDWADYFGNERPSAKYSAMAEAMAAVKKLNITSRIKYRFEYKNDPLLPSNPHRLYKEHWIDWYHFLSAKKNQNR